MAERRTRRAFTLIELMIVVVIVGVLSILAVTGYKKYTYSARNAEAVQFLGAVRASQEVYFQAFGRYCGAADAAAEWPADNLPFEEKKLWGQPNGAWGQLGIKSPGRTWFKYRMWAGAPGQAANGLPVADPTRAWYVAQAIGNHNMDNIESLFEVTSEKPDVYRENENE